MLKFRVILLLISFISTVGLSQNMVIDSLENVYSQAKGDKERVDLLIELGEAYYEYDSPNAIALGYDALALARKSAYSEGIFYAYNTLGLAYNAIGPKDSAYYYARIALDIANEIKAPFCLAVAKNNIGIYYLNQGNYPLSLQYFQEALEHDAQTGEYVEPTSIYANIGIIHEELGDEEKAIEYYRKSAEAAKIKGGKINLAYAHLDYGYIDWILEKYDSALYHYEEAIAIYQQLNLPIRIAETLFYTGEVYYSQKYFEKALSTQKKVLSIYEKHDSKENIPSMYAILGNIYRGMGNYEVAISNYKKAIELASNGMLTSLLPSMYEELALVYVDNKDFEKAYQYELMYRSLKDTFLNEVTRERIAKLESTYKLKIKESENEKLINQQEDQKLILHQRTLIAIATSLIALLLVVIAIILFRSNKATARLNRSLEQKVEERTAALEMVNKRLLESNDELERFTYIASHDLKEPLRNITSFVNLIQRKLKDTLDEDLKDYMGFVIRNTKQLYSLVEDILAHSRIEAKEHKAEQIIDLNIVLEEIKSGLLNTLKEKKATLIIEKLPIISGQKSELFLVMKNLIENGLKYNESPCPEVLIRCVRQKESLLFEVSDNGIGIAPEYHERIFEMFSRLNNRSKYLGSGIGLATCKKIVQKYEGKIWLESKEGEGSSFFFTLPEKRIVESEMINYC